MRAALALAERGLGATWPNPSVGCVIVRDGRVVGRGRTGLRGRPHAETEALAMAGDAARGAIVYVTLEPCSHHGHTPPCADALVAAGVAMVVVAAGDPDPRVNGAGLARLRAGGVEVVSGVLAAEASETLAGFFARVTQNRPLVTLKLAATLDGRIATRTGASRWITGPAARRAVHALRGRHDAVMVGAGTAMTDDPDLACRLPGFAHRPTVRIVADSRLGLKHSARLVTTAHEHPTWVLYHTDSVSDAVSATDAVPGDILPSRAQRLAEADVRCVPVPAHQSEPGLDLPAALRALATRGLTRVLVEGGARLASALLRADLVDRLVWFSAPGMIGGDGLPAIQGLDVDRLDQMKRFRPAGPPVLLGGDVMTSFTRV